MKRTIVGLLLVGTAVAGCAQPMSQTQKGAMIGTGTGAAAGALLGQLIGKDTTSTMIGAGAGAAAGALTGGMIGKYMDKQEAAMRQELGAADGVNIKRNQDNLDVNFKSDLLFDVNSAVVMPGAVDELAKFAKVVNAYPQTTLMVSGHTDSTGSQATNEKLSQRRAESVKSILVGNGVASERITTIGYGETRPVADNETTAGKAKNRRVDITIKPVTQQQ